MHDKHLVIVPRDGLFFKDARGWHTSASGRGRGLPWPFPMSLLGALRTVWGREIERRSPALRFTPDEWCDRTSDVTLDKTLPLRRRLGEMAWEAQHRVWPVPADALFPAGEEVVRRLDPLPARVATLGRDDDPVRESLWWPLFPRDAKPLEPPQFWTEDDFVSWLADPPDDIRERPLAPELPRRLEVHLEIDPSTFAARDGALYATDLVETLEGETIERWEWAIAMSAKVPQDAPIEHTLWTLGGDRRIGRAEPASPSLLAIPSVLERADATAGIRLVVVTPASFEHGWLPDGFEARDGRYCGQLPGIEAELQLCAAFVPRALHHSGWDMVARSPKAPLRLVPPGATYFLRKLDPLGDFTPEERSALWLAPLGSGTIEGRGRVVAGCWTPVSE